MALVYEIMENTFIPNTIMTKKINNGNLLAYDIMPEKGYVLHDKELDSEKFDPETPEPTGEVTLGYYPIVRSCSAEYDFGNTITVDGYTAYGEREFFARPASEVADGI